MIVHGLLLAAGAGRRMGTPKALVPGWLQASVQVLHQGGCDTVTVVLGAAAEDALPLVPEGAAVVVAADWDEGMGASLRAGLRALTEGSQGHVEGSQGHVEGSHEVAVVHLVDLPDVTAEVVRRILAAGFCDSSAGLDDSSRRPRDSSGRPRDSSALVRAVYDGVPGHPVLIGRRHWGGVIASATGDQGARAYLKAHDVTLVECGDLATGADVDTAPSTTEGQP